MTVLQKEGDEVQGERIICEFRKKRKEVVVPLTSGHRGMRMVILGLPARAKIDRAYKLRRQ